MRSAILRTVVVAALVLGLLSCGSPKPLVLAAAGAPDSKRLEVGLNSCQEDPEVRAVETDATVTIIVESVTEAEERNDCVDVVDLTLNAPLGTRSVVDDATGAVVGVDPLEK